MLRLFPLLLLTLFSLLTRAIPFSPLQVPLTPSASSSAFQLVFQFSEENLENLAVRSNGNLVLTIVNEPLLYELDPRKNNPSPTLLYNFTGVTSMVGIVETAPDVFAVIGGNSTQNGTGIPGTFSIWSVDLNTDAPNVNLIASVPEASALNGLTTTDKFSDTILAADSTLGAVFRVNVVTGNHSIAMEHVLFQNTSTAPRGINGIHTYERMLYFTNSAQRSYGRVPITDDGSSAGEVEMLGTGMDSSALYDDFDLDWKGNAWIATHGNGLSEVTPFGKQRNFTDTDPDIAEDLIMMDPTSVKFGRGSIRERNTLYMVTHGPLNCTASKCGQVIAVNTALI